MSGWSSGKMLFTDEGQKKLARLGLWNENKSASADMVSGFCAMM
jgi:hypothetical protein